MHPFRQGLLQGQEIALSGAVPHEVGDLLRTLGARVSEPGTGVPADEKASPLDALVCGPGSGATDERGPHDALEHEWAAVSTAANASFIPARRGRIVLLAPRPGELPHAEPARAALENLARTLSVEWARFGLTTVAVAPGAVTTDNELAQVVAFICSPAGDYFSGCRFDLGLVKRGTRS